MRWLSLTFLALSALLLASLFWSGREQALVAHQELIPNDNHAAEKQPSAGPPAGITRTIGSSRQSPLHQFTCELHAIESSNRSAADPNDEKCIDKFLHDPNIPWEEKLTLLFNAALAAGLSTPTGSLLIDSLGSTKPIELVPAIIGTYHSASDEDKTVLLNLLDQAHQINLQTAEGTELLRVDIETVARNSEILQNFVQGQIREKAHPTVKVAAYSLAINALPESYSRIVLQSLIADPEVPSLTKQALTVRLGVAGSDSQNDILIPIMREIGPRNGSEEAAAFNSSLASAFSDQTIASTTPTHNREEIAKYLVDSYYRGAYLSNDDFENILSAVTLLSGSQEEAMKLLGNEMKHSSSSKLRSLFLEAYQGRQ